jgi:hypothetical protein
MTEEATNDSNELTPGEFKSILEDYRHAIAQSTITHNPEPLQFQVARMYIAQKLNNFLSKLTYE